MLGLSHRGWESNDNNKHLCNVLKQNGYETVLAGMKTFLLISAFTICFYSLWGILLYRHFILDQALKDYADIFILTLVISAYVTITSVFKGAFINLNEKIYMKKTTRFFLEFIYFSAFILFFSFITGITEPSKLSVTLLIMILVRFIPIILAKVSERITDKKL